jgi:hypothetical protein
MLSTVEPKDVCTIVGSMLPAALLMREFRASDRLWGRATGLVSEEIKSLGFTSLNLARFHKWSMKYLNF